MTSGLCNPKYYIEAFLEIRKSMEVREEGMEVQEEAACGLMSHRNGKLSNIEMKKTYKSLILRFWVELCFLM